MDPFSLMNYILLSYLQSFLKLSGTESFHLLILFTVDLFNLHASSIPFPVQLGDMGLPCGGSEDPQSWTDSGFSVQVYIPG